MERIVLQAPDGQYYTDGTIYGKELHLAEGMDGSDFHLVNEIDVPVYEEATEEDYISALERLGVHG